MLLWRLAVGTYQTSPVARSERLEATRTDRGLVLHAAGFSASVDAFAWEPDPNSAARRMRLWLLSLLGPQESVKALAPALSEGRCRIWRAMPSPSWPTAT